MPKTKRNTKVTNSTLLLDLIKGLDQRIKSHDNCIKGWSQEAMQESLHMYKERNAQIVHRLKTYDALVVALREMVETAESRENGRPSASAMSYARAVLAAAEKEIKRPSSLIGCVGHDCGECVSAREKSVHQERRIKDLEECIERQNAVFRSLQLKLEEVIS